MGEKYPPNTIFTETFSSSFNRPLCSDYKTDLKIYRCSPTEPGRMRVPFSSPSLQAWNEQKICLAEKAGNF